jgi:hypothetical protein
MSESKQDEVSKVRESRVLVRRKAKIGPVVVLDDEEERVLEVHEFITTPAMIKAESKIAMCLPDGRNSHYVTAVVEVIMPCYVEELVDVRKKLSEGSRIASQDEVKKLADWVTAEVVRRRGS